MPTRHGKTGQRDVVRSCTRSNTEGNRRLAFTGELAVAHHDVVRVVVLAGRIRFACRFGARYIDERVIVCCRVIGKFYVLNGEGVDIVISSVTVDVELTRDSFAVAVDRQVQPGLLVDHDHFGDVREQGDRNLTVQLMRRINRRLDGLELVSFSAFADLCDRADQMAVHVRVALDPNIGIGEVLRKVDKCQICSVLLAIVKVEVKRTGLRINLKRRVKGAVFKMGLNISRNAVIAAVAHAELAVCKRDLFDSAVRGPAVELAAAHGDGPAVVAVDIERIDRIDLTVFDHDIRAAAFAQNAAERTADRGILDRECLRCRQSFDQDRAVPSTFAAARNHNVVNNASIRFHIDDTIVVPICDVAAVDRHIADRDGLVRNLQTVAVRRRDLQRGLILAFALQRDVFGNDHGCRDLMLTRKDFHNVAVLGRRERIRNGCVRRLADLGDDRCRGVGDHAIVRFAFQHGVAFLHRVDELDLIVCFSDLQHIARDERILRVLDKGDNVVVGASGILRVCNARVAYAVDQRNGSAEGVLEFIRSAAGDGVEALRAVCKLRRLGEEAAGDRDASVALALNLAGILAADDEHFAIGFRSVQHHAIGAAEGVAAEGGGRSAGALHLEGGSRRLKIVAADRDGSRCASQNDAVLGALQCAVLDCDSVNTRHLGETLHVLGIEVPERDVLG